VLLIAGLEKALDREKRRSFEAQDRQAGAVQMEG